MKSIHFLLSILCCSSALARDPNFIIIFTDDQGYGDLGCFGSKTIKTPHIDKLAAEGLKLTDFHVPSPVCSPSRAGLLTGCYPKRVGMHRHVVFPANKYGLHPDEYTIADHLKANGYATACIGKWHLGHLPETLPTSNGFDSYFGIPYSHDMSHPDNKGKPRMSQNESWKNQDKFSPLWKTPLLRGKKIIEHPVNQRTITRRYTDEAIKFVEKNKDKPFFLYLPHSMPHIPLYVPEDVLDLDPANAYKCVIEHIDAECGRIFKTIKDLNLEKDTYIIFTTDNGPWLQFKNHGGSAGALRAGKGTTFEGGQRVPFIISRPGTIPAGKSSDALVSSIDLLPTIAKLSGHPLESKKKIDGLDLSNTLLNNRRSARNEFLHYSSRGSLDGIRQGDWKLLVYETKKNTRTLLYNLANDLGEEQNLTKKHPELVTQLTNRMKELDAEITKNARPVFGKR